MFKGTFNITRRTQTRFLLLGVITSALNWMSGPAAAQTSGLVAAYSFNAGAGTTLTDSSGLGNTGTIVGATWTTSGKYSGALSFNGTSSYVDLGNPTSLQLTGSMTLEAWVFATATPPDDGQIIAKGATGSGWQLKTSPDTGVETFGIAISGNGTTHVQRYSKTVRALNTWYHVAGVYNASAKTLDIYVNGVLDDGTLSGTVPASQANAAINANIGRRSGGYYFPGTIDELRVYKVALTAAQIQADMNTPISPDTQPPTAPTGLTATAVSGTQINLSWTASTDNVGVTGYFVERQNPGSGSFVQVGTPTGTTFNDTGLTNGSSYSYRVRATDAAGNLSPYSSVASATTPDTQPPTAPTGLTATAVSGTQINLSWTASTDNVGVTGYMVERQDPGSTSFVQVGTPTGTTFNDTGLVNASSYSYRVRATDAAGNLSGYSSVASATTPDTQPPTAPTGLTATAVSQSQINLSWTASTDNVGVTGYLVERQNPGSGSFVQVGTPAGTTFSDTGLTAGTNYNYRVRATDAAGNLSLYSTVASATTLAPDTQPPTAPTGLTATAVSGSQINLSWTASTDNVGVTGYLVERQNPGSGSFVQVGTPSGTTFNDSGLTAGTNYSYRVRATDAAGNLSLYSAVVSATTLAPDTQPPTAPTGLTATAVSGTQINLSWTASTDNVGVTGYLVERQNPGSGSFVQVGTPSGTTFNDTGLTNGNTYGYRVRATDAAGNLSLYSTVASATTPDTQPPTAPTGLTATAVSGAQINLSWTASTDNVGVTGYLVERQNPGSGSFVQVGTPSGTTFNDTGLTNGSTYNYRVRATDAAGNLSLYSSVASATTPDTQAPTAPTGLTATAVSSSQINLSWTASTDNVGVTGYLVERQNPGSASFVQVGTPTGTTFNDSALTPGTNYSYRVRATDAAGNLSPYSAVASATTPAGNAGLVAAYSFNEGTGTTITDSSGLGNTGTIVGATWTTVGKSGGALSFNGTSSYVDLGNPTSLQLTGSMTLEAWVFATGTPPDDGQIIAKSDSPGTGLSGWQLKTSPDTGVETFGVAISPTPSSHVQRYSKTVRALNTWYHVAGVYNATAKTLDIYVNGVLDDGTLIGTVPALQSNPALNANIGRRSGGYYFQGTIDELRVYKVALTAAQIQADMNTPIAPPPPDTIPPTAPASLTASGVGGTQIELSWAASTDNVGVTGYLVERQDPGSSSFAQVGTVTGTTYFDTMLAGNTNYSYRVRATDAAGNLSPYSPVASATTLAPAVASDNFNRANGSLGGNWSKPTISTNNLVVINNQVGVDVENSHNYAFWSANSFNDDQYSQAQITKIGPWTGVILRADAVQDRFYIGFVFATNDYRIYSRWDGVYYSLATGSNVTWQVGDILRCEVKGSVDPVTVTMYRNGTAVLSWVSTGSGQVRTGGSPGLGIYSPTGQGLTMDNWEGGNLPPDTTPPTAPGSLTATAVSQSQINLSWSASTDNVGVTGYLVERQNPGSAGFAQVGTPTGTTFSDTGLAAGTNYSYRVRATDAAGNLSGYSPVASATTLAPDTQPPTAPASLTATAINGGQINLSWAASTDNVGVTGYLVERENPGSTTFAQIGTASGTTYNDTGLSPNSTYSYQVRATDAAGNLSGYSPVASATTPAANPGLAAAYSFNEGAGTTVTDSSANGNSGTIFGATWTTSGKYGDALSFDGSTSYVDLGNPGSLQLTGSMTLEAWVFATGTPPDDGQIIAKSDTGSGLGGWQLKTTPDTGVETFGVAVSADGNTHVHRYSKTVRALNTWYHVAGVYNASAKTLDIYVNGVLDDGVLNGPVPASQVNPALNANIGRRSGGYYFQGTIDEVRVYSVALTATQIQADMNTPLGLPPTAPGNLAASVVSGSQVDLSWTASTASAGVAGYLVERCQGKNCSGFAQIGTTTGTNYSDTGLTVSTAYSYRVRAIDSVGTLGPYSQVAQAFTGLVVSPSVAALTFTRTQQFTASSGSVTWSVDGVTGGSAASGTITTGGLYTPPSIVGTHTVTATTTDLSQTGTAMVYITGNPGVFTYHNDNFRTGQNTNETVLTTANVNPTSFGKLFAYTLDGQTFSSPLYVANVNIPGQGFHNALYVATEHDSVYAFDADGLSSTPLWHASFINPAAGVTTIPLADIGNTGPDIPNEVGITSTPVIDSAGGTIYVVAKTKEVSGNKTTYVARLHALDITTGAEKLGGPVVIPNVDSLRENQRTGLLLANGVVYFGFASHGDISPWNGEVLGYNAATLQPILAFNAAPAAGSSGIWMNGCGPAVDASGSIYFITGNGTFDANTGGSDYGDSFVKISPAGVVVDYFTPFDQATLDAQDLDLCSGGVLLLPDQAGAHVHEMVSAGKGGTIYLVDRDNMGHFHSGGDLVVQSIPNIFPNLLATDGGNFSSPVFYNGSVYFGPVANTIQAFQLSNGLLSTTPTSQTSQIYYGRGGTMAVSANGNANGIFWALRCNDTVEPPQIPGVPGTLHAYDATNLGNELYNSDQAGSRDTLDFWWKFTVPIVVNGKVFITSVNQVTAYGLLP
ncbi:MAG TPA: fibronectin type III domain-containing protein [Candidatus Acidoferrum sp.]|jgi:chitodextrinase|nr:fibronectin type III domain-containing protein [Candidatus Acidoferrum sp.]